MFVKKLHFFEKKQNRKMLRKKSRKNSNLFSKNISNDF